MSELCLYTNRNVPGAIQSWNDIRGYCIERKNFLTRKLKLEIDLNQNFEIPRIRSLKSLRSNYLYDGSLFNDDFCKKKLRIVSESFTNEPPKTFMSKSLSELFLSSAKYQPDRGNEKKKREESERPGKRAEERTLETHRSESFGNNSSPTLTLGKYKPKKTDAKKNVSRLYLK